MTAKLREADARALDMLLDRAITAQGNAAGQGGFVAAMATSHIGVSNEQIVGVERVLHLLDAMPSSEPAHDLLQRTLERIDANIAAPLRGHGPSLIDTTQQHA